MYWWICSSIWRHWEQMLLACLGIFDYLWWDCERRRWPEERTRVGGVGKLQRYKAECRPSRNSETFRVKRCNYFSSTSGGKKPHKWMVIKIRSKTAKDNKSWPCPSTKSVIFELGGKEIREWIANRTTKKFRMLKIKSRDIYFLKKMVGCYCIECTTIK